MITITNKFLRYTVISIFGSSSILGGYRGYKFNENNTFNPPEGRILPILGGMIIYPLFIVFSPILAPICFIETSYSDNYEDRD